MHYHTRGISLLYFNYKEGSVIAKILTENKNVIKLTKKAIILAEKYKIKIEELGLEGIIKEKDLIPYICKENQVKNVDRCLFINKKDKFINYLFSKIK